VLKKGEAEEGEEQDPQQATAAILGLAVLVEPRRTV
jgi:hypothetical protein